MLMSGTDNHIAGVGVMSEQKGRDPDRWNVPGHEGFLKSVLLSSCLPVAFPRSCELAPLECQLI